MSETEEKKTSLWTLFLTFAKVGVMTFGGGIAMLPILEREVVTNRGWATSEQMLDYYAIGQCTPGVIAVNVATFIGHKEKGFLGAVVATLGVIFPSVLIITALASVLQMFQDNVYVRHALNAISVCVAALILDAVLSMAKKGIKDIFGIVLCLAVLYLSLFTDVSPILIIIGSGILGVIVQSLKAGNAMKGGQAK